MVCRPSTPEACYSPDRHPTRVLILQVSSRAQTPAFQPQTPGAVMHHGWEGDTRLMGLRYEFLCGLTANS